MLNTYEAVLAPTVPKSHTYEAVLAPTLPKF